MSRTQTLVQLNELLLAALDQRAAQRGVSRSQIVREAIEAHLAGDFEDEIDRRIVAGYERIPQATVDDWGDPVKVSSATARDTHRRLDAEERAAGHEPW
ncbi:MAG TPA: CopG family transcriptional regulator [Acidimicrobiales bacterium]|nr:CopG family transcriptional regulator [Acidimicrobiales bacterium]